MAGDDTGQLCQDRLQAANYALEQVDATAEGEVHVRLDRAFVVEIDDADLGVLLAKAVDTPDALLDAHGIPGHVVVDQGAAELEVEALGGGVGTKEHVGLAGTKEI